MRRLAILAIVLGSGAAGAAAAATPASSSSADALAAAAFAHRTNSSDTAGSDAADPIGHLLDHDSYASGQGVVSWRTGETALSKGGGASVVSLRVRESALTARPGELPYTRGSETDPKSYEVSVIGHWPGAFSLDTGKLSFDVSPHAGFGVIGGDRAGGGSAEAGATLRVSPSEYAGERLKSLGVRDGANFGDRGRWYLFAAASGRAVGLNMLHGDGGWNRAGWSTDPTSKLVGDAQVGVGWRKGDMQTSVGFVHREVKGDHMLRGVDLHSDSMVAFSLSIRPQR